jgi:hypothetical protein
LTAVAASVAVSEIQSAKKLKILLRNAVGAGAVVGRKFKDSPLSVRNKDKVQFHYSSAHKKQKEKATLGATSLTPLVFLSVSPSCRQIKAELKRKRREETNALVQFDVASLGALSAAASLKLFRFFA